MARLTIEDCLEKVPNRYELVLLAAKRAKQIAQQSRLFVEDDGDKPTVLALREIAEGHITRDNINSHENAFQHDGTSEELDLFAAPGSQLWPRPPSI